VDEKTLPLYFSLFNEIAIISQLSRAEMDAQLPDGLLSSHFGVLNHLIRVADGTTPLALAKAFQVPKTTMTHTLSGLEKHKLVEMRPNPQDGRSKCVWLSQKGRQFHGQAIAQMVPGLAAIIEQFPAKRIEPLVCELINIRKFMDERRNKKH
jgi:DNA-binding MarR family transcriptional regulator